MCLVVRLFQEEIRQQTLASLLMLPRSVPHIVYMKLMGCLTGLIPGMIALFTAFFRLAPSGNDLWDNLDEPPVWWFIANMFLVIHLSAMLSLYLRWGAFAMSLAITVGSMLMSGMLLEMLFFVPAIGRGQPERIFGLLAFMATTAQALPPFCYSAATAGHGREVKMVCSERETPLLRHDADEIARRRAIRIHDRVD